MADLKGSLDAARTINTALTGGWLKRQYLTEQYLVGRAFQIES